MKSKIWYKSKTIWAGIIIIGVAALKLIGVDVPIDLVVTIAAGFGIVGIRNAIDQKED